MKLLISAVCLVACAHAMPHSGGHDMPSSDKPCYRREHTKNEVYLDGRGPTDYKHIDNAAFIQSMEPARPNSKCIKGLTYGFDMKKVTVWASGGCEGTFHVDYLKAHCKDYSLDSNNKAKHVAKTLDSPCYANGASFSMKLLSKLTGSKSCNYMDEVHTGIGGRYGFALRTIWADFGCAGNFEVCEVGLKMSAEEMKEHSDMLKRQHSEMQHPEMLNRQHSDMLMRNLMRRQE